MDVNDARGTVLMPSEDPAEHDLEEVKGYNFNNGIDYNKIMESYLTTGFQATHFGKAVEIVRKMIESRKQPCTLFESEFAYPEGRKKSGCTIFLGYTSNMVTSGLRDIFRYLAEHNMIDCIVTSAGGIEEDFIKCLKPTFVGDFHLSGSELRKKGLNRAGNLLIPNSNYCAFENWLTPILEQMSKEQPETSWTPSKFIDRLGKEINNPESIYYWAHRNRIPVFCPALTDGSLGDMIYFFNARAQHPLKLDIAEDLGHINTMAVKSERTGVIILGGGFVKHHICNANLMRNGADFAIYINTGQEFDGSDSGASPDEAVSWGKLRHGIDPIKVSADATLVFPELSFRERTLSCCPMMSLASWILVTYCIFGLSTRFFVHATTCYTCASPGLKENWELTGLPAAPTNSSIFTVEDCTGTKNVPRLPCSGSTGCFFGTFASLYEDVLTSFSATPGLTPNSAASNCLYAPVNRPVSVDGETVNSPLVGWMVGIKPCEEPQANVVITTQRPLAKEIIAQRLVVTENTNCHYFCSKTTHSNSLLFQLVGKLDGRWFEIRGCTQMVPFGLPTCIGYQKTLIIEQLGTVMNQSYWSTNCVCEGDRCNSAVNHLISFSALFSCAVLLFKVML
ncbi:hypothetical protein M3Y97_00573300 [Aphelenchoides bicaudatus]|nr:hypothetical protein M3Y97_00573300 [Aphelenchoides bicaudatus]